MNLGIVCNILDRYTEALSFLVQARQIAPDDPQILLNTGGVLQSRNQIEDAEVCYLEALRLRPDYATALWNLAQVRLLKGDYPEGFRLFEARFAKRDPVPRSELNVPYWHGEPLDGLTIIVTTEQAFGDAIQFSRYVPLLAVLGARVVIFNHLKPLQQLLKSLPGVFSVVSNPGHLPSAEYQIPMLSLPHLIRTTINSIPAKIPYLYPSPDKVRAWEEKVLTVKGMRIGLAWAGRRVPDPRRSATLRDFARLGEIQGISLISLQIGPGAEEAQFPPEEMTILDITREIEDFEDTAALIEQLDLVISVDTSVAHLAGAMGKRVWLLLPFSPDWRWLLDRTDSPWYPTMQIFRQKAPGEWGDVIRSVAELLLRHAKLQ